MAREAPRPLLYALGVWAAWTLVEAAGVAWVEWRWLSTGDFASVVGNFLLLIVGVLMYAALFALAFRRVDGARVAIVALKGFGIATSLLYALLITELRFLDGHVGMEPPPLVEPRALVEGANVAANLVVIWLLTRPEVRAFTARATPLVTAAPPAAPGAPAAPATPHAPRPVDCVACGATTSPVGGYCTSCRSVL